MRHVRWRDRSAGITLATIVLVAVAGCVGTVDRDEFNQIIQERGGGFTSELALDAVDAVGQRQGVDGGQVELKTLSLNPSVQTVVLEVQDPAVRENLDRYVVREGSIDSVEPMQVRADEDVDAETFPASRVALVRIERMVGTALAEFDSDGGYVSSLNVSLWSEGNIVFYLGLESPRSSGNALFDAEGRFIRVDRT